MLQPDECCNQTKVATTISVGGEETADLTRVRLRGGGDDDGAEDEHACDATQQHAGSDDDAAGRTAR